MTIGFIGLGKMGQNIILHLLEQVIDVVGYNRTSHITDDFKFQISNFKFAGKPGKFDTAHDLLEVIKRLAAPRVIWLMVKAGEPVDEVIDQLLESGLQKGDTLIDGGNSFYKDSIRRHERLKPKGINFVDSGTSGGLEGARFGACLMLGGDKEIIRTLDPLWNAIAVKGGCGYMGPSGAGHYVKMIHNGIEYGFNQSLGEGFELLSKGPYQLNLEKVATTWNHGSIVRSYLLELLSRAFAKDPHLEDFTGKVGGGETGTWTVKTAKKLKVSVKVLQKAVEARGLSHHHPTFATKVVSALRKEYGGHEEKTRSNQ